MACKSSLQGIGVGNTDGNQTPLRGQIRIQAFHTSLIFSGHAANEINSIGKPQLLQIIRIPNFFLLAHMRIYLYLSNKNAYLKIER